MKAAFEKYGGEIDMSEEALYEMWESDPTVLAETLSAKYIRMKPNPDVATVFEEFIHTAQYRTGLVAKWVNEFGRSLAFVKIEIQAQEKLIRNAPKWGIPAEQVERIKSRLQSLKAIEHRLSKS